MIPALVAVAAAGAVAAELTSQRLIRRLRADFQWLIDDRDERPELDPRGLERFVAQGYDPELGWTRKPNTAGVEQGRDGPIEWHIDAAGAREDRAMDDAPARIVAVGDSYTFGRQVRDQDAWPAVLGRLLGARVLNFGVGNYGLDQAVLRYRRDGHAPGAVVALLGVVPETIVRIHSAWRHYSEYGNTFAFKPRFRLRGGELELLPNVIDTADGFARYRDQLPVLRERDYFYAHKFRLDLIRFPYVWHWLARPRNRQLVRLLRDRERRRLAGTSDARSEALPFRSVMVRNIRMAGALHGDPDCRALFVALVRAFAADARAAGAQPVFVMFPQLLDLECFGASQPYRPALDELAPDLLVIDAAEALRSHAREALYAEDVFGGHYSVEGNAAIARFLEPRLGSLIGRHTPDAAGGRAVEGA